MDYEVVHESELPTTRMSDLYREYVEADERKERATSNRRSGRTSTSGCVHAPGLDPHELD